MTAIDTRQTVLNTVTRYTRRHQKEILKKKHFLVYFFRLFLFYISKGSVKVKLAANGDRNVVKTVEFLPF